MNLPISDFKQRKKGQDKKSPPLIPGRSFQGGQLGIF